VELMNPRLALGLIGMAMAASPLAACSASSDASPDGGGGHGALEGGKTAEPDAGRPGEMADAAPSEAGSTKDAAGGSDAGAVEGGAVSPDAGGAGRQSLVWVWMDYPDSLAAVAANAASFTHVSPSLYQLNYDYTSGVAQMQSDDGPDDFDGLSSAQIASMIHAAGMKCIPLIQAGAGNSGTDQGIQNVLADSPGGTQAAFISAMVGEAVAKGYDGYSLDWEVGGGTDHATYGTELIAFLGAFRSALHDEGMLLSLIVGDWYVEQSDCSGDTGLVDLKGVSPNVDQVIMMAYDTTLGTPPASCTASVENPQSCGNDFASDMNLMCAYVPEEEISIGYDSDPNAGNNPIAGACVSATQASGIPAVAIWPEYNTAGPSGGYAFCDTTDISPAGATWFELLAGFLAGK
jgi:Glycosyl hydrolases family 18